MKAADLFIYLFVHLGDKNCCSMVLLWKENCLAYISVLYFERSCYNEETCKPVHSSVLCSIQNFKEPPPRPSVLISGGSMEGGCVPSNQHRELIHTRWFLANGTSLVSAGQTFFF